MAQTSGPAKPGAAVFKAEWEWIRAAIAEALRPYPEALAAVVKALGQWDRVG